MEILMKEENKISLKMINKTNSKFEALESEPIITIYPVAELPMPYGIGDKENDIIFLDPTIGEGKRLINDKTTTIPHLFALLRQFIAPVCHNVGIIIDEIIKRGAHVNDVDATTGMTLFHYAVRATALSDKRGLVVVKKLLSSGADPRQRCLYSGMNALHIAAYFDVPSVALLLLKTCNLWPSIHVDSLCDGFDFGTSLHIACSCLSSKVVDVLLQKGASLSAKDDLDRTPLECIPADLSSDEERRQAKAIKDSLSRHGGRLSEPVATQQQQQQPTGLTVGSKVFFTTNQERRAGEPQMIRKTGILRYIGSLPGRAGDWAGIELDSPTGQNSGELGEVTYFNCKENHGVFVPASLVTPTLKKSLAISKPSRARRERSRTEACKFKEGDRVLVAGKMEGTVRYVGETQFASGLWCGVELDTSGPGRNNGSVGDVTYFKCPPTKGVFSPPSKLSLIDNDNSAQDIDISTESNRATDSTDVTTPPSTARTHTSASSDVTPADSPHSTPEPLSTSSTKKSSHPPVDSPSPTKVSSHGKPPRAKSYLRTGLRVGVRGIGRRSTVKFLGETDFAPGLWVGLDLGAPCGRNDGSVQGHRYFTCPAKHGLMLRPRRVTYNGVSGDQMLPPELQKLEAQ